MSGALNDNMKRMQQVRDEGYQEGLQKGRQEILDWLQEQYLTSPTRPDRGSPKAQALLLLAKDAAAYIRSLR